MIIAVKVIANSSRDQVVGWFGDQLKLKVRAQPEKGRANDAVIGLLAELSGLSKNQVSILAGQTNASKQIELIGISEADLLSRLPRRD